ncbi:hypothetical protein GWI33_003657 [Rhynchophorus ferrugineus]|uniref:Uncharacterized protein n=1 Tax=Rhynchophorus ferrugineus TaxID=354439 RepID=A0A834IMW4_RHYFE|nr:hypothetical protein GWI33_003657 [Rhynchophorus ferrugineus]
MVVHISIAEWVCMMQPNRWTIYEAGDGDDDDRVLPHSLNTGKGGDQAQSRALFSLFGSVKIDLFLFTNRADISSYAGSTVGGTLVPFSFNGLTWCGIVFDHDMIYTAEDWYMDYTAEVMYKKNVLVSSTH